jgi:hypothetical protein
MSLQSVYKKVTALWRRHLKPNFPIGKKGQNRTAAGHMTSVTVNNHPTPPVEGFVYYNCIFICEL